MKQAAGHTTAPQITHQLDSDNAANLRAVMRFEECGKRLLDHCIGRGQADAKISLGVHDDSRQNKNVAVREGIPMPIRITVGHLVQR